MLLIELIPKLLFCHHIKSCLALFHSSDTYTVKVNFISPSHLFSFYPSEVSEVNKINVFGIGHVSEKVTLVSENMLYVSEILVKITHILE